MPDLDRYQRFLVGKLLELPVVKEVRSNFAIQTLKVDAPLPLAHLEPEPPPAPKRRRGGRQVPG